MITVSLSNPLSKCLQNWPDFRMVSNFDLQAPIFLNFSWLKNQKPVVSRTFRNYDKLFSCSKKDHKKCKILLSKTLPEVYFKAALLRHTGYNYELQESNEQLQLFSCCPLSSVNLAQARMYHDQKRHSL